MNVCVISVCVCVCVAVMISGFKGMYSINV